MIRRNPNEDQRVAETTGEAAVRSSEWVGEAETALEHTGNAFVKASHAGDDYARDCMYQAMKYLSDALATKRRPSPTDPKLADDSSREEPSQPQKPQPRGVVRRSALLGELRSDSEQSSGVNLVNKCKIRPAFKVLCVEGSPEYEEISSQMNLVNEATKLWQEAMIEIQYASGRQHRYGKPLDTYRMKYQSISLLISEDIGECPESIEMWGRILPNGRLKILIDLWKSAGCPEIEWPESISVPELQGVSQ